MINAKNYKEILLSFPGERQQKINESAEVMKEEIYKSGEQPLSYTSTSYAHKTYEQFVVDSQQKFDNFLKRVRTDVDSDNLGPQDVDFILSDVLSRVQQQIDYAKSSIEAMALKKQDESTP
jgi:hypothetical protein